MRCVLGCVMMVMIAAAAWADLVQMDGPPGADIRALTVDAGGNIWASGTYGGVFTMAPGGSWERGPAMGGYDVQFDFNGTTAAAVNNHDNRVFVSSDGFATHTAIHGPSGFQQLDQVAVFDENEIVISTGLAIYRTANGGDDWNEVYYVDGWSFNLTLLHGADGNLYAFLDNDPSAVSTDHGATWTELGDFNTTWQMPTQGFVTSGGVLLAGGTELSRSTDGGASWTSVQNVFGDGIVGFAELDNGTLVVARQYSAYVSTDEGATWTQLGDAPISLQQPAAALTGSGSTLYLGTEFGVFVSEDAGTSWSLHTDGMIGQYTDFVAADADGNIVATNYNSGLVFVRAAGGGWTVHDDLLANASVAVTGDGTFVVAGTELPGGNVVYTSTDGGASWSGAAADGMAAIGSVAYAGFGDAIFVSGIGPGAGLYRSTDGGATFTEVFDWWITDLMMSQNGSLYATSDVSGVTGVHQSTDNGETWNHIYNGSQAFQITESANGAFYGRFHMFGVGISSDAVTWEEIDMSAAWEDVDLAWGATAYPAQIGVAGETTYLDWDWYGNPPDNWVHDGGLELSTDGGSTWSEALPMRGGSMNLGLDGFLYVGTGHGIYRVDSELSVEDEATAGTPLTFALAPAYPNPFNPSTTLAYSLDQPGHTRLAVYDVLGREVARLVDATRAAGHHAVSFDASALATGTYFARLSAADGRSAVQRLVLMK